MHLSSSLGNYYNRTSQSIQPQRMNVITSKYGSVKVALASLFHSVHQNIIWYLDDCMCFKESYLERFPRCP